ncbi:hypothetical protein TNCV_1244181 [Trichonephila clavipes]|nr:hypothetical protein TNCV_1244181 [Trichonephila clavipes]
MPRAHQAGFSRRSLAGVGLSESVRCHGPGLVLLTNGGVQQHHRPPFTLHGLQGSLKAWANWARTHGLALDGSLVSFSTRSK